MKQVLKTLLLLFFLFLSALRAHSADEQTLFREDFNSLDQWEPFYFRNIQKHSTYSIVINGDEGVLQAESNRAASAIIYTKQFNVFAFPKLRWRWKVDNIYTKGDAKIKEGDDYPLRIYVLFESEDHPEEIGFWEQIKHDAAKLVHGESPPHSTLNYIWANKKHSKKIIISAYTEKARMILLQKGSENIGEWIVQEVNILNDYRKAFKEDPPPIAKIGVMNDSDDTGERSVSYLDFIEIGK